MEYWTYPDLRKSSEDEQDSVLRKAEDAKMDALEVLGMTLAVALSVVLTRYSTVGLALPQRIGAASASLFIAVPLLLLFGAPFYVRRVRRVPKAQFDKRQR